MSHFNNAIHFNNNHSNANPEMRRRAEWEDLNPDHRLVVIAALKAELLRLHDCVEDWVPTISKKSSTQFEVMVDISKQLKYGVNYTAPVPETIQKSSKSKLRRLSGEQD